MKLCWHKFHYKPLNLPNSFIFICLSSLLWKIEFIEMLKMSNGMKNVFFAHNFHWNMVKYIFSFWLLINLATSHSYALFLLKDSIWKEFLFHFSFESHHDIDTSAIIYIFIIKKIYICVLFGACLLSADGTLKSLTVTSMCLISEYTYH